MSCGTQFIVQRGASVGIPITGTDGLDGPAVDADAVPTITALRKNGAGSDEADATLALTIVQAQDDTPAAIPGEYELTFNSSACAKGDTLTVYYSATRNGVTSTSKKSITIVDDPAQRFTIC